MKLNKLKLFSFCKLHFLLAALFLYLLFAVNWIPEERILEHSELSLQFLSEHPGNDFFPSDLAPMEDESALLLSLARYKYISDTWILLARRVEDMIAVSDTMRLDVNWEMSLRNR